MVVGGKAGQGPNYLTKKLATSLLNYGYFVFYSRDYQSLIRGGHNFNILTFSDKPVFSNDVEIDVLVALDENTEKLHKGKHKIKTDSNDKEIGEKIINLLKLKKLKNNSKLTSGSKAIAEGSIKSGIDIYYAYPMTPATPVLGELASKQIKENFFVFEPENEIAVANAGVGSAITGAKVMVGTSGGGFDLMSETLSMCGIAEVPLVFYLAQRPGPGTGVPTYTQQGDLDIARFAGHGEFQRIVLAPGDPKECEELISQCFYFSQKFKIPSILISDKHLAESCYTREKTKITKSTKSTKLKKYNSYEATKEGYATEDPEITKKNFEKRLKKQEEIKKEAKKFTEYKIYGKKNSENIILSWGSTKGAIIDAISDLDCKFLQILYMEPFPDLKKMLKGKNIILIENNSTGLLSKDIKPTQKILKYDGRAFFADELKKEIKRFLK